MTVVLLRDVYTELVIDVFYIFNSTVIDELDILFYQLLQVHNFSVTAVRRLRLN